MTELLPNVDTPSDGELISRVRGGDVAAYGDLFSRHVDAAKRLARQLVRGPDHEDLVAEAFAKVLSVLQNGGGPDVAFRAYLLTAVRRLHVDRVRSGARLQTTDDLSPFDPGIPFQDTAVSGFESGAAAKAFASLPERWQLVLWHLEVEGQKPAEIAPLLGMSANSVSALAYRAREGLRQAFLTMHLNDISETDCRWVNEHLGAYVRNGLSKRDSGKVRTHLDECRRCTAMYLELTEVNSNLSALIAPLVLGAAATAYLGSAGGASVTSGLFSLMGRVRDVVTANATAATAGAAVAGVAAVTAVGVTLAIGHTREHTTGADRPIGIVSSAPATPGAAQVPTRSASPTLASPSPSTVGTYPFTPASPAPLPPAANAAVPPAGATDSPAAAPTDTTSGGTGGTGGQPGGGQTGQPAPTAAPTTGQPGPTQTPTTDQPTPTETPTTPEPTSTATTAPPPGTDPHVTANVWVDAEVGQADNSVTLRVHGRATVTGAAALPPELDVGLSSDPGGISFTTGGPCEPDSAGTSAHCVLVSGGGQSVPLRTDSATADADASVDLTFYFTIPPEQPATEVRLKVTVPDGYHAVPGDDVGVYQYTPPASETPTPLPEAPLVMGDLSPQSATPDNDGRYQLTGHVTGIPTTVDKLTFELPGVNAVFDADASGPAGCEYVDDHHVTCDTDGRTSLDPHFVLTGQPGQVSITVQVPGGYSDTSSTGGPDGTEDNSAGATLAPKPNPKVDVSVTNLRPDPATPQGDGTYLLTADVAGFPKPDSPPAVYTLSGAARVVDSSTAGCTVTGQRLTCTSPADGTITLEVAADDLTKGAEGVTLGLAEPDGYDDDHPDNNTSNPVALAPLPTADLGLSLPAQTHEDGNNPKADTFPLDVAVTGLPAGTELVKLSRSGDAAFEDGNGCTGGAATVTCAVDPQDATAVVHPTVTYDGQDPLDLTLTAQTPAGYADPTPDKAPSATTTLQPEAANGLTARASLNLLDKKTDGTLTVTVSGAARGHSLALSVEGKNEHANGIKLTDVVNGPCTRTGEQAATCDSGGTFVFAVDVPSGLLSGKVTVDDDAHSTAEAAFSAPPAEDAGHSADNRSLTAPRHMLAQVKRQSSHTLTKVLHKGHRATQHRVHPRAHHEHPKVHKPDRPGGQHAVAHLQAWKSKVHAKGHGAGLGHTRQVRHGGHAKSGKRGSLAHLLLGPLRR
jgi:RNA polymerase sigma factor (sigma-70 family)